jgi:indole-3-glycerol phosphate synthase
VRPLVGVNARDLETLAVARELHLALARHLPAGVPCVAESGISPPAGARAVAEAGYRLALVGSALMRAADPVAEASALLEAGRACARRKR